MPGGGDGAAAAGNGKLGRVDSGAAGGSAASGRHGSLRNPTRWHRCLPCTPVTCRRSSGGSATHALPAPTLQYYDMPSPSLRNAIYHDLRADVAPFRVSEHPCSLPCSCKHCCTAPSVCGMQPGCSGSTGGSALAQTHPGSQPALLASRAGGQRRDGQPWLPPFAICAADQRDTHPQHDETKRAHASGRPAAAARLFLPRWHPPCWCARLCVAPTSSWTPPPPSSAGCREPCMHGSVLACMRARRFRWGSLSPSPAPTFLCSSADTGHQALAELLVGVVQTAVQHVVEDGRMAEGGEAAPGLAPLPLPPPMIPGNADVPTSLCAMQVGGAGVHAHDWQWCAGHAADAAAWRRPQLTPALPHRPAPPRPQEDFKPLARAMQGFAYLAERPDKPTFVQQKWGYRGEAPGGLWQPV